MRGRQAYINHLRFEPMTEEEERAILAGFFLESSDSSEEAQPVEWHHCSVSQDEPVRREGEASSAVAQMEAVKNSFKFFWGNESSSTSASVSAEDKRPHLDCPGCACRFGL